MNDVVILICTRPESKRLPGKVFKKLAGIPAIEILLSRLDTFPVCLCIPQDCRSYDYLTRKFKIDIFEGDPFSPLHRMADAIQSKYIYAKWIIRITHDDLLIDMKTIKEMIDICRKDDSIGYAVSPTIIEGAGVEIIRRENLIKAALDRKEPTEFVSYFVKNGPFSNIHVHKPRKTVERPYRLTMDYPGDANLLEVLFRDLGHKIGLDSIVDYLDKNQYLFRLNHLPDISIYTCAYNSERFIDRTMRSVLFHQNPIEFEYIFVDDGSTDRTLTHAARYSYDDRLKIIVNESNMGLASSSNIALDHSLGRYVMRVDSDDLLMWDTISKMAEIIDKDRSGAIYSSYHEIDENDETIPGVCMPNIHWHAGCALMDKRMINEIRFTDGLKHYDSLDLYNRIKNKKTISVTTEPLWYYRRHGNNLSSSKSKERKETFKKIMS